MKLKKGLAVFLAAAMVISVAVPTGMNASASEPVVVEDAESQAQATSDAESEQKNEEEAENATPEETKQDTEAPEEKEDAAVEEATEEPAVKDAAVEEAEPQAQDAVNEKNEPAVMSLLPLEEVEAIVDLTDYTGSINAIPLNVILDNMKEKDGTAITLSDSATQVWIEYGSNAEGAAKYTIADNPELDLEQILEVGLGFTTREYQLQIIAGSGNQLDAGNIRYVVSFYGPGNNIRVGFDVSLYQESAFGYRSEVYDKYLSVNENGIKQISFILPDDSMDTSYYIGANVYDEEQPEITTDFYTKAEFEKLINKESCSAITDQFLNQDLYETGQGYKIDFTQENVFYAVYRSKKQSDVIYAYERFQVRAADTAECTTITGNVWKQNGSTMTSVLERSNEYDSYRRYTYIDKNTDKESEVEANFYRERTFYINENCSDSEDYYVTLDFKTKDGADASGSIDKIVASKDVLVKRPSKAEIAGMEDIKDQFISKKGLPYGYKISSSDWASLSILYKDGRIEYLELYVEKYNSTSDTSFYVYGAKQGDTSYTGNTHVYRVPWNIDTYNDEYGYQTLFLNSSTVDLSQLKPVFSTSSDENGTTKVYVGSEQKSGESIQDFSKGTVQYTASYNNQTPRNYWVTFAKKEAGARLFVNGPSEREVLLTAQYGNKHDILIANIGDAKLTGLKVELNATHVKLDDYWTVGGDGNDTLAPFTTTEKDYSLDYGELANLARIRLLPDGAGIISGTLTISADGQEPVVIKLTGYSQSPYIVTEELDDAVKYVPYSYMIATNNHYEWNQVTFKLASGKLPAGMSMSSVTGEIYGVPTETGEFPIRVEAENKGENLESDYADFTLVVKDNSNAAVYNSSDEGYQILETLGIDANGDYDFVVRELKDQLFVSNGQFAEFQDLWLNGEKLTDGVDYTKVSGSTRITIKSQTFANKAKKEGTNTIAAEFRVGGDVTQELKRTAQNFRLEISDTNSGNNTNTSGNSGSGSGSSGGSGSSNASETRNYIKALKTRILDANGQAMNGVTVELHSTPRVTVTDTKGMASFDTVEFGKHTLIVKDSNGNVLAQRNFELVSGNAVSVNGDKITAKGGSTLSLTIKVVNRELQFVTAVATGDTASMGTWMILALSALLGLGILVYRKKYFANK